VAHNGYLMIGLWNATQRKTFSVHRLVALVWVPNPRNKPEVNHKDGDILNNHHSNLEWVTGLANLEHAVATGLRDRPAISPVDCFSTETGKKLCTYRSMIAAQRAIGDAHLAAHISAAVSGKAITAGGYQWRLAGHFKRLPPLTTSQINHSLHTCANYHVRNVTTGEEFTSNAEVRAAGYDPCGVAGVVAGRHRVHANCEWERVE